MNLDFPEYNDLKYYYTDSVRPLENPLFNIIKAYFVNCDDYL